MSCPAPSCPGLEQPSLKQAPSAALRDIVQPPFGHGSPCSAHPAMLSFSHHMCCCPLTSHWFGKGPKGYFMHKNQQFPGRFPVAMPRFPCPFFRQLDKRIFPLANSHSCLPAVGCGTRSTLGDVWGCFPRGLWVCAPKEGQQQPCWGIWGCSRGLLRPFLPCPRRQVTQLPPCLSFLSWETCHHSSLLSTGPAPVSQYCLQTLPGQTGVR